MLRGLQVFVSGIALAGFTLAGAAVASAQDAPAAKNVMELDGDAAVVTILIKPDKTADFESVISKYKEQQLAGMKFFKGPAAAQGVPYIIVVDPVMKGQEYDITRVITEVFPVEVQALYQKYKDSFAGRGISALTKVQ